MATSLPPVSTVIAANASYIFMPQFSQHHVHYINGIRTHPTHILYFNDPEGRYNDPLIVRHAQCNCHLL